MESASECPLELDLRTGEQLPHIPYAKWVVVVQETFVRLRERCWF